MVDDKREDECDEIEIIAKELIRAVEVREKLNQDMINLNAEIDDARKMFTFQNGNRGLLNGCHSITN